MKDELEALVRSISENMGDRWWPDSFREDVEKAAASLGMVWSESEDGWSSELKDK